MKQKISIKNGTVEETLSLPLWGRAYEKKGVPFFTKVFLSIPDWLGVCCMVHLRIK